MAKKKKFEEEENMGEQCQEIDVPQEAVVEEQAPAPEAPQKEAAKVNEENFMESLKAMGGKASANGIRKQLGLPVVRQTNEPLHWYAAEVRNVAKKLIKEGKIKMVSDKRTQVYQLVEDESAPVEETPAVEETAPEEFA